MKKRIKYFVSLSVLIFVSTLIAQAQVDTLWTKTYGGASYEWCNQVQQTTDGGYIIVGYTNSFGAGLIDLWLIKTDPNGDTIWTKTYGGSYFDEGWSVQQTKEGGYIVAGMTNGKVWLIKTDSLGEAIWKKTLGGGHAKSIDQTRDGGYIIVGDKSVDPNQSDILLIKTDSFGDTIWTKTFGSYTIDLGVSVIQNTEDEYVLLGYSYIIGIDTCLLIKTDALGNTIWTKKIDLGSEDRPSSFQQTTDGGYIIAGYTNFFSENGDVWIYKTNTSGDSLWTKVIGKFDCVEGANSIQQTVDGGYIISGFTQLLGLDYFDILLIKTDADGDSVWTKTFGGELSDYGNSVQQTTDGGYMIAGITESFGAGESDIWLIKTTADVDEIEQNNSLIISDFNLNQNYPNPFNPSTTIRYFIPEISFVTLKVYDVLGGEITTLVNEEKSVGNYEVEFSAKGGYACGGNAYTLPSGIYFYQLQSSKFVETKKMVLLR